MVKKKCCSAVLFSAITVSWYIICAVMAALIGCGTIPVFRRILQPLHGGDLMTNPSTNLQTFIWSHAVMFLVYLILLFVIIKDGSKITTKTRVIIALIMLILMASDIAVGMMWMSRVVHRDQLENHLLETLQDKSLRNIWDHVQAEHNCCGVRGASDFVSLGLSTPASCFNPQTNQTLPANCFKYVDISLENTNEIIKFYAAFPVDYMLTCLCLLLEAYGQAVMLRFWKRQQLDLIANPERDYRRKLTQINGTLATCYHKQALEI